MSELYPILRALKMGEGSGGGGGFTPTDAQLTAMNSGIDSEKVAQIGTNTTNILLKAADSDVSRYVDNIGGYSRQYQTDIKDVELGGINNGNGQPDTNSTSTVRARTNYIVASGNTF